MNGKFGKDLTTGSIPRHLLTFSLPMLIGNLIQVSYSLVNAIWVGNLINEDALGAIGVSFNIIFILIGLATGITMATTILVSQYYGAKNFNMVEKVVNNSFSVSLILGLVLTVAGIFFCDPILRILNTPVENFGLASSYLKIYLLGFILTYMGFLVMSILRGVGDTVTPLIFMAVGIGINAVLDPLLILGFGPIPALGLNGTAVASIIAQGISTVFALVYLNKKNHIISFNPKKLILEKDLTVVLLKIGLPSMVQQTLVSIGVAAVSAIINTFGSAATNAFSAVSRVDNIAFMPAMSLGMAASALTGQNLGANKPERVKEIFKWGVIMTSAITLCISLIGVLFPKAILVAFGFGNDAEVLDIGITYLRIVGASYILFAIMFVSNGIINGAGHTITTMLFSLLSLWVIRVPLSWILSRTELGLKGIWISVIVSFAIIMVVSVGYYLSGRWKKAVVKHSPPPQSIPDAE